MCFLAGTRTRASIAVSLFDHSNPYKRSQAQLSAGSTSAAYSPSSSSLLGPLNLHMYLDQALLPAVLAPSRPFDIGTCIEEDELEHETSSQPSLSTYDPGTGGSALRLAPRSDQAPWGHGRVPGLLWPWRPQLTSLPLWYKVLCPLLTSLASDPLASPVRASLAGLYPSPASLPSLPWL